MNATDESSTCHNWVLVNDGLLQVSFNLSKKSPVSDSTENPYSIGPIHVGLAIHIFHQRTSDDNNLSQAKLDSKFQARLHELKTRKPVLLLSPHQRKAKAL